MATLPNIDRTVLERVMTQFDSSRPSPHWKEVDWAHPGRQKYAVRYNGRLYPPKEVIRRAMYEETGRWPEATGRFYGGDKGANPYLLARGFTIVAAPFKMPPVPGTAPELPQYTVVLEPQDSGWLGTIPALQGCYAWGRTQEETLSELNVVLELIAGEYEDERKPFPPDVKVHAGAA